MFETTDDFILFEYENFYGFWKAMEKYLAVYANRQIWASLREREQIIYLHAWVKNWVMLGISTEAHEYTLQMRRLLYQKKTDAHQSKGSIKQNPRFRFSSQVQALLLIPRVC